MRVGLFGRFVQFQPQGYTSNPLRIQVGGYIDVIW